MNGGTCVDHVNRSVGFETRLSRFCQNMISSSLKFVSNSRYSCSCVSGYDGDNCENEIDECGSNPCQNGAQCINLLNEYQCNCTDGYSGKNID